jgi:hypothetical protein
MEHLGTNGAVTIVFGILVPGFLLLVSVILVICGFADLLRVRRKRSWPSANGTVVGSEIMTPHKRGCRPFIRYRFTVNGQTYESTKFFHGQENVGYSWAKAEQIIAPYPPGTAVTVRFDPRNPSLSVVVIRSIIGKLLLAAFLFAASGVLSAALAWTVAFIARR